MLLGCWIILNKSWNLSGTRVFSKMKSMFLDGFSNSNLRHFLGLCIKLIFSMFSSFVYSHNIESCCFLNTPTFGTSLCLHPHVLISMTQNHLLPLSRVLLIIHSLSPHFLHCFIVSFHFSSSIVLPFSFFPILLCHMVLHWQKRPKPY